MKTDVSPKSYIHLTFDGSGSPLTMRKHFDLPFFIELEPGNYDLRTVSIGDSLVSPKEGKNIDQLPFSIPKRSIIYLGVIDIELASVKYESVYKRPTKVRTKYTFRIKNDFNNDLILLEKKYPLLYKRLKGNIVVFKKQ